MAISGLKNILRPGFVGHSFKSGYRFQRYWDRSMAMAFFCGETGAGLFIISMLTDFMPGVILGLLITGVGKTYFHLAHMGVPARSWRAILRPDRAWISRGLLGIVFFVGFGAVHVMGELFGLVPEALAMPVYMLSVAGAMVAIVYQGFAMSHSTAISLWSTGLMPVSSMLYGLLAGTSLITLLCSFNFYQITDPRLAMVSTFQIILIFMVQMTLFSLLHGAKNGAKGAQQSYYLLTRDFLCRPFVYGVVIVGTVLPLLAVFLLPAGIITSLIATASILAGFCLFRLLMFRAAVLDPILSPVDIFKR